MERILSPTYSPTVADVVLLPIFTSLTQWWTKELVDERQKVIIILFIYLFIL